MYFSEVVKNLETLLSVSGIYKLYDKDKNLLYIGKSKNLGNRIVSSKEERKAFYYSYAITKTMADACIYEPYYIAKLKPLLNVEHVTDDSPSFELPEIEFEEIKPFFREESQRVVSCL